MNLDHSKKLEFFCSDQGREITETRLIEILSKQADHQPHLEGFLTQARTRGGLLEERNGVYHFIHLAFQEFLVARYLREVIGAAGVSQSVAFLAERLTDPWWREPVLLLVGYWASASTPAVGKP